MMHGYTFTYNTKELYHTDTIASTKKFVEAIVCIHCCTHTIDTVYKFIARITHIQLIALDPMQNKKRIHYRMNTIDTTYNFIAILTHVQVTELNNFLKEG